ncbi:MAG: hypothetical protein ACLU4N_18060 [Butyricimonas faecihominis]
MDSKVEKKALRNLKAEQLRRPLKWCGDGNETGRFRGVRKLMKLSGEIRQLNLPDPWKCLKEHLIVLTITRRSALIGINKPDRNELAWQIDSIVGATEAEKEKAKRDAGLLMLFLLMRC